jgi:hypothetical protein
LSGFKANKHQRSNFGLPERMVVMPEIQELGEMVQLIPGKDT